MSLNVGRNFKLGELREQCHNEAIASRTFNLEKYQTFLHSSSLPTKSFMINKEAKKLDTIQHNLINGNNDSFFPDTYTQYANDKPRDLTWPVWSPAASGALTCAKGQGAAASGEARAVSFVELVLCVLGVLQEMHGVIACVVWRLVYVRGCVERFTSVKFMCGQLLRAYYDTVPPWTLWLRLALCKSMSLK